MSIGENTYFLLGFRQNITMSYRLSTQHFYCQYHQLLLLYQVEIDDGKAGLPMSMELDRIGAILKKSLLNNPLNSVTDNRI